jgi:hypothetical protein
LVLDYAVFIADRRDTYITGREELTYAGIGKDSPGEDILNQF